MESYDGADAIERAWRDGLKPDPLLTVSAWADRYRVLSQRASSEPGRWRTERTPYLREIMDCLSPASPVQRVALMKGAQIGGTECGNCWIGYVIHQAPGPMMAVAPTVELAKRNSKQRIDPLIEESEVLRERVKERRSRDSGNTVLSKEFPGGVLILTGTNSAVGLCSMPARYLFLDEVDGYPGDVEGEGDPILLAERRSATFQRRKILLVSTPKTKGLSRIQREYDASDQRRYFVPCPHCREHQTLELANLRWPEGQPREAEYACAHCGALIGERHKTWMLEHGEWRATAESDGRTAGFHLSSLYSPVGWFSWGDAAEMYERAQKTPNLMKSSKSATGGAWRKRWRESRTTPSGGQARDPQPLHGPLRWPPLSSLSQITRSPLPRRHKRSRPQPALRPLRVSCDAVPFKVQRPAPALPDHSGADILAATVP